MIKLLKLLFILCVISGCEKKDLIKHDISDEIHIYYSKNLPENFIITSVALDSLITSKSHFYGKFTVSVLSLKKLAERIDAPLLNSISLGAFIPGSRYDTKIWKDRWASWVALVGDESWLTHDDEVKQMAKNALAGYIFKYPSTLSIEIKGIVTGSIKNSAAVIEIEEAMFFDTKLKSDGTVQMTSHTIKSLLPFDDQEGTSFRIFDNKETFDNEWAAAFTSSLEKWKVNRSP